jgi:hypothetical protein
MEPSGTVSIGSGRAGGDSSGDMSTDSSGGEGDVAERTGHGPSEIARQDHGLARYALRRTWR